MNEPKYQWSIFPEGDHGQQFVVRSDEFSELKKMIEEVQELLNQQEYPKTMLSTAPQIPQNYDMKPVRSVKPYAEDKFGEPLWCDYHDCAMYVNRNGHRYHKDEQGNFCNGFGQR